MKTYLARVCQIFQKFCCPCADCRGYILPEDPVGFQSNGNTQKEEERKTTNKQQNQNKKRKREGVQEGMEMQAKKEQ